MNILNTQHTKIHFNDRKDLKTFNRKCYVRRDIKNEIRKRKIDTIEDMAIAKVDVIFEKVMKVLDTYPFHNLDFNVTILPDDEDVSRKFMEIYGKKVDYIAFYSRRNKMVYFSARHAKLRVVAHEFGHVVAELWFSPTSPSRTVHEIIAQATEKLIYD